MSTNSADEKKPDDDTVTLVPVPDEDIIKFAKAKCSLCLGLGKLKVTAVGGADPKMLVCNCATKRFVVANRAHLAVGRDKKLFYRQVPEGVVVPADEGEEGTKSETPTGENQVTERFKVMSERISLIDKELAEIGSRYDRQLEPLEAGVNQAAASLSAEQAKWQDLGRVRHTQFSTVRDINAQLEELAKTEKKLRADLETAMQSMLSTDEELAKEPTRLQPFHRAVADAKDKVEDLAKRRRQALKPGEQRKASLLKRMGHKAASLGLSVEDVLGSQPASE